ncbi:hypothetical protein [Variovorax ginsengisoli]|uniref:GntR family transcriptional regulator n=1 Tax=Variovorax ginsengisoli TaxID=363844 RepID=A0ABT9SBM1_9BURK|nr:hypothetical protein [Variovorax ginsengisoli]MDP9901751.1 hypothetical protein [Variovorax ginsengisoli]
MTLNSADFTLHDVARFPLVLAKGETSPGYAAQWEREMQALLAHGKAFVLVHPQARAEEAHEDRKRRGLWLKQNKQALGACCKAVISVEPDDVRRTALAAQSAMAEKAFGIPMRMAATLEQACADGLAIAG